MFWKKNKNQWLTPEQQAQVVAAIQNAERTTSGEVRVFIEATCPQMNVMDRAKELFFKLKMDKTELRNGVLIYLSYEDHQFCLLGDEGIYAKTNGPEYWKNEVAIAIDAFKKGDFVSGLVTVIGDIGKSLQYHFPYNETTDKNELPDDIVFG